MNQENPFLTIEVRTLIFWLIFNLLGLLLILISIAIPWGIFVLLGDPDLEPTLDYPDPRWIRLALYLWFYGAIAVWCGSRFRRSHLKLKQLVGKVRRDRQTLRLLLLVAPLFLFSLGSRQIQQYATAQIAPRWIIQLHNNFSLFFPTSDSIFPLLYNISIAIVLVFVAPILEELLFRGFILQRWGTKWGLTAGIFLSSIAFSILYLNNWMGQLSVGVVMAILYIKTRTLIIPIAIRVLHNSAIVLLSAIALPFNSQVLTTELGRNLSFPWIGLAGILISAPWLLFYLSRNWLQSDDSIPYWSNSIELLLATQRQNSA